MLRKKCLTILVLFLATICSFPGAAQPSQQPATATQQQAPAATTPAVSDPAAIDVLEKYVAAIGGHKAWDSVKAEQQETEIHLFGSVIHTMTIQELFTKKTYTKVETSRGTVEVGFDGQRVWQKTPAFRGYMADTDPQAQALRNPPPPLREFRTSKQTYERLPDETIDGKTYQVLKTTRQAQGQELTLKCYFDPATHLVVRVAVGNLTLAVSELSDYRNVDGRLIPFLTSTSSGAAGQTEIKVLSYKSNPTYDPSIFEFGPAAEKHLGEGETPKASAENVTKKIESGNTLIKSYADEETIPEQVRLDSFELVWGRINDTYWDKTFGGVDWKAIHDQYLPKAKAAIASRDFHSLLNQMLGNLNSSHFVVEPPSEVTRLNVTEKEMKNGSLGLSLRWIDNQLVVIDTRKGYPAERVGIRQGYVITRINGKTPEQLFSDYKTKHLGFELRPELLYRAAAYEVMQGRPGDRVVLDVLDEKDRKGHLDLVLTGVPLDEDVPFESRKLKDNLGYISFKVFFGGIVDEFQHALDNLRGTDGLIIDLRGNPGGVIEIAPNIANLLCPSPGSLGTFTFRYEKQSYSFKGLGDAAYSGKVVVLVDEASISSSEIFSGGLQDLGRVTVVGSRTAGAVLASTFSPLPTGGTLQYVISNFETSKGTVLEGRGVIPQIEVRTSRAALLAGHDPALEKAEDILKKHGCFN
jgi:carboxyl-terminal processing protease